jgi:hypothetical protein
VIYYSSEKNECYYNNISNIICEKFSFPHFHTIEYPLRIAKIKIISSLVVDIEQIKLHSFQSKGRSQNLSIVSLQKHREELCVSYFLAVQFCA